MEKPIVIVGVGALGSHAVLCLRNCGHPLHLIDHDRVEAKNILGQFHTRMGLGRNKAQALQQGLLGLFGVRVEATPHKLTQDNVEALLGGAGLVLDCVDNAETRQTIQEFVRVKGIPCLHGAISADGSLARAVWDEHFQVEDEGNPGQATCEDGVNLAFHVLVGAFLAQTVQAFLKTGVKQSSMLVPGKIIPVALIPGKA